MLCQISLLKLVEIVLENFIEMQNIPRLKQPNRKNHHFFILRKLRNICVTSRLLVLCDIHVTYYTTVLGLDFTTKYFDTRKCLVSNIKMTPDHMFAISISEMRTKRREQTVVCLLELKRNASPDQLCASRKYNKNPPNICLIIDLRFKSSIWFLS